MNILLLIGDSLRAENTSLHGYERETTPFLKKLSNKSLTYKNAISPSVTSLPSHASIFTGLHAQEHQIYHKNSALGSYDDIFQRFQQNGYTTGLFTSNAFLTGSYGLAAGFDIVDKTTNRYVYPYDGLNPTEFLRGNDMSFSKLKYLISCLNSENTVEGILNGLAGTFDERGYELDSLTRNDYGSARGRVDRFLDWSASVDGDWAACLNFTVTHNDYLPLSEYDFWASEDTWQIQDSLEGHKEPFWMGQRPWSDREALVDLYDGTIRQLDQAVSYLYQQMKDRNEIEETIIIFTSDHGEGFGEYSEVRTDVRLAAHGFGIDDPLLRVPLLIHSPDHEPRTVRKPVSLTGIGTAFRDGSAENFDPQDIQKPAAIAAFDHSFLADRSESELAEIEFDWEGCKALAQAGYSLVDDELVKYATWGDAKKESPIRADMESKWQNLKNQDLAEEAVINHETKNRLRELGYL